jgi:hypothetical protein
MIAGRPSRKTRTSRPGFIRNLAFSPDPPPSACQTTSTKEKHVEDPGFKETDKKISAEIAQGKEGGETGEEEELIHWWASSFARVAGPVSRD